MNLIVIMSDTLRYDHLGCHGNSWIHTPNFDRFSERCVIFDNAYQASFPTIPTRTDMFTGNLTFPFRGWTPLPEKETVVSEELTAAGYVSMLICDTPHLVRDGHRFDRGFTGWDWIRGQEGDRAITDDIPVPLACAPEKIRGPERMRQHHYRYREAHWRTERDTFVARTMQCASEWLEHNYTHDQFLLYIDTFDPHEPWDPPQHYVDRYDPGYTGEVIDHPVYDYCDYLTEAEIQHTRALYAGEVSLVDTWLGYFMDTVDRLGLWEDTAILLLSDHGHYIGDHGRIGKDGSGPDGRWPFYQEVSHIVFMGYVPGCAGSRSSFLAQPTDIRPTLLDLAGLEVPQGTHGVSLVPYLRGETGENRNVAVTSHALADNPGRSLTSSITDGEWVLHYRGHKWPAELYHLPTDPGEAHNRYATERAVAERLHAEYIQVLREAGTSEKRIEVRSALPD